MRPPLQKHACLAESLERRRLLTTLIVNTAADTPAVSSISSPLDATGHISLRSAIENFNDDLRGLSEPTVINFGLGAGTPKIMVGSSGLGPLPSILANINGFAFTLNGNTGGATRVELDGSMAGNATGLTLAGANAIIEGLIIDQFAGSGIDISGSPPPGDGGHLIRNNFIGTDPTGMIARPNGGDGILIEGGTPNNTIGGTASADRNVISGNGGDGIHIQPLGMGEGGPPPNRQGNQILGNYIGLNATGAAALPNGANGIAIEGDATVTGLGTRPNVIGNASGGGNVISGNAGDGILIQGFFVAPAGPSGNTVQGNYIGTDPAGVVALGNQANGVHIAGSPNNSIGGAGAAGNIISGNHGSGVLITLADSTGNTVHGNSIGTNTAGTTALPNTLDGAQISLGATSNEIGGSGASDGNLISGNLRAGTSLQGANTNRVQNNTIGPNRARTAALPNGADGVSIGDGTQHATVTGNNIEGNTANGVLISGANQNSVLSNFIGSARAHNGADGVRVAGGAMTNLISGNSVGNNTGNGIAISASDDNSVTSNIVIGNGGIGVSIAGGSLNVVGGSIAQARNIISGNFGAGVSIDGGTHNTIQGNYIGVDASGNVASPNGVPQAPQPGVSINTAQNNVVSANLISANSGAGVRITGDGSAGNLVSMNQIGGNADGSASLLNGALGIDLGPAGVTLNTPGGPHAGANHLQNFPVLAYVAASAASTFIAGSLNSSPNASFTVELFSNLAADATGYGQGQTFVASVMVNTDASGNGSFRLTLPTRIPPGRLLTATATSSANDTSEFSQAAPVGLQGDIDNNGVVGFSDLLILAQRYGMTNATPADGDLNADGSVGFDDLLILAQNYGQHLAARRLGLTAAHAAR